MSGAGSCRPDASCAVQAGTGTAARPLPPSLLRVGIAKRIISPSFPAGVRETKPPPQEKAARGRFPSVRRAPARVRSSTVAHRSTRHGPVRERASHLASRFSSSDSHRSASPARQRPARESRAWTALAFSPCSGCTCPRHLRRPTPTCPSAPAMSARPSSSWQPRTPILERKTAS